MFWQEGLLLSGIKAFYLFSSTWFVKHIFSYIFNALTSLLQKNANLFAGSKTNKWHFQNRRKFSEKCSIEMLKKLSFYHGCHDISCHKEAFQKPIMPCHDYLSFSFQSYSTSMLESIISLPYISWLPTCIPFLSDTRFPQFPSSSFPYE